MKKNLDKITEQELKAFVLQYSKIRKDFKSEFELYFASKNENFDVERALRDQIRKSIKKYSKWNFIDYAASNNLGRELGHVIKQGQQYLAQNNLLDAFLFCKVYIKETVLIISFADDSNGYIGDAIIRGIELLIDLTSAAPIPLKEKILHFIEQEVQDNVYFEYGDFGYKMIDIYADLSIELNREQQYINCINDLIKKALDNKDAYKYEYFVFDLIQFYRDTNKSSAADQLIQSNMHLSNVRKFVVQDLIEQSQFVKAKMLLNEGIEIANKKGLNGVVLMWEKLLLHVAESQNDIKTSRAYLERFAFESSFNNEFYKKWKNTFSEKEWAAVIESKISSIESNILNKLKSLTFRKPDYLLLLSLGPIFIEERMDNRLLELLKKQTELNAVLTYHAHMCKIYPEDLIKIYLPLLELDAASASERSDYKRLLQIVCMINKDIPSSFKSLANLIQRWKSVYKRRPAMLDEINSIIDRLV